MRVIAGSAKRLQLKTIEGMDTRPTTDRIKETLFNMITPSLYDCRFLDLFAGSGGIGIEALSRGAKEAVFVEKNPKAVSCIKENLKYTRKYFDVKDDEEINLCAAGSKEESLKTLQELDERKMYIGYVSLDKIMSYADFKKYVDKQDLAEVWCAVQVAELEKEEEGVVNFQSNIPNIGFVCNTSYNTAIKWDEKKYPNLLPGCETQDMGNEDEWDAPEENLKSESNARQHFVSLLNYLSNQKKFLAMMEKDNSNYTTKELKEMVSYIKKNGIKVYGFTTIADKETLLKLSKQSEVYEIYTEEVR